MIIVLNDILQQQELMVEDNHPPHDDSPNEVYSFSKMLTSTEASTHAAGIYIPKEHAERCFPPLVCFG
jgi:hypothetical protein